MRFVVLGVPMAAVLCSVTGTSWTMYRRVLAPSTCQVLGTAAVVLVLACVLSVGRANAAEGWNVDNDGKPTELAIHTARYAPCAISAIATIVQHNLALNNSSCVLLCAAVCCFLVSFVVLQDG